MSEARAKDQGVKKPMALKWVVGLPSFAPALTKDFTVFDTMFVGSVWDPKLTPNPASTMTSIDKLVKCCRKLMLSPSETFDKSSKKIFAWFTKMSLIRGANWVAKLVRRVRIHWYLWNVVRVFSFVMSKLRLSILSGLCWLDTFLWGFHQRELVLGHDDLQRISWKQD